MYGGSPGGPSPYGHVVTEKKGEKKGKEKGKEKEKRGKRKHSKIPYKPFSIKLNNILRRHKN